jgi:chemotaxis protein methyltransferase CheR
LSVSRPTASPQILAILSSLIEEKTGIHYAPSDFDLMRDKVMPRAEELGCDSLLDYYYLLRYDDECEREMDSLIDLLVVPETYFFREFDALKFAIRELVVEKANSGARPRIWCAASATGEEPLTVAMLLADADVLDKVELVASDVSYRVLARAKAGEFGARSVRAVPEPKLVARFLERTEKGYHVKEDLGRAIDFRRVNLVDERSVAALGLFDVVLCRNVLIYFKDETAARVLSSIRKALLPDGTLFVGTAESLMRLGTSFACQERAGTFFYRVSK